MLTIKAEVSLGDMIEKSFIEAIELSKKLNCFIEFDFNGINCVAYPKGNAKKGKESYHSAIKNEFKIATS